MLLGCAGAPHKQPVAATTTPARQSENLASPAPEQPVASEASPSEASSTTDAGADGDEPSDLQTQAVEACQAASELADKGDAAHAIEQIDRAYSLMLQVPDDGDEATAQAKQDIRLLASQVINRVYRPEATTPLQPMASWDLGLPMADNEHVQREIKNFTTYERDYFLAAYARSGRYRPMILAKLEQAGLPSQLSWLPLVESLFKVSALSRASALGLWQFISSTGLRYGLKRDAWLDERLDPEKSTDAAIAYLIDLHRLFGDWPKALAAYNCGEGRIQRLQKRSQGQYLDFWDLYGMLPDETRRYFPRLLAVLDIIEDPAKYGITLPELESPLSDMGTVTSEHPVKLDVIDRALGLPAGTLSELNPELRYRATPAGTYELRVPAGRNEEVLAAIASAPEYKPPRPSYVIHRVRSGETLSTIAERYRSSVSAIMRSNNIRSAHRIWPGQRLRIPVKG